MIKNHDLIDRFFRYVKIDTQSAEDTGTQPSTAKQHDLAGLIADGGTSPAPPLRCRAAD